MFVSFGWYDCLTVLTAFIAVGICLVVWRLYFHPLSGFPGPKLAAATYWYTTYYEVWKDGSMVEHIGELHQKYGPVVRTSPNELHFNSLRAYNDIYTKGVKFTKDPRFYTVMHEDESSFCFIDPKAAKARRDILLPLFSRRAILELQDVILTKVNELVTEVLKYEALKEPVSMPRAYKSATLDIILSYCFARDYQVVQTPSFSHQMILDYETTFPLALVLKHFPWIYYVFVALGQITERFTSREEGRMGDVGKRTGEQIDELIARPEVLQEAAHETIYHHLLTPHPEKGEYGKVPSKKSLVEESINLLAAGSDTVGNTAMVGTFYILNDPVVHAKLYEELKEAWPDKDNDVRYETLEKLPYLTAVIKESLRVSHGVVFPAPRVVGPTDASIDGVSVPAGTVVSMGCTFLHYNPEVFPDPYTFDPERWLQPDTSQLDQHLVAFSKGPRSCLGVNLAWCEMYLLFGYMFRRLDMQLFDTTVEDMKFKCHFTPTFPRDRMLRCLVKGRQM